jgi:hypothetical protein
MTPDRLSTGGFKTRPYGSKLFLRFCILCRQLFESHSSTLCTLYYYTSKFARLAQICGERKFSNSEIYPAKAQRREVRRGKSKILTNYFHYFFRPLRPWRLCGRYSEFRLRLCRARLFVVKAGFSFYS